jgi:hypothetical protein
MAIARIAALPSLLLADALKFLLRRGLLLVHDVAGGFIVASSRSSSPLS